jgi:hypothetical protein
MAYLKRLFAATALAGMASAAGAQTSALRIDACVPAPAAEALMLTVAPEAIRKVGEICAPFLAPGAILRRAPNAMIGRYAAESDAAWPAARGALGSLAGEARQLLDSELARPLLTTLVSELLVKEVKPRDCGSIDRILGLIEPLPPRNAAALVVTLIQLTQKPERRSAFTICPDPRRR